MSRRIFTTVILVASVLAFTTRARALVAPELTPVPCTGASATTAGKPAWSGTISDLLFADALVACSTQDSNGNGYDDLRASAGQDLYEKQIIAWMAQTLTATNPHTSDGACYCETCGCASISHTFGDFWAALRANSSKNCEQGSMQESIGGAPITPHLVSERVTESDFNDIDQGTLQSTGLTNATNGELRTAGVNLCVATTLRTMMPGSAGGEALLLSAAEQRRLLEIIRERSQIAMLQYAILAETFFWGKTTNPPPFPTRPGDPNQVPALLFEWGYYNGAAQFTHMGSDFATAVQLNHTVVEEMAALLARSRDADPSAMPPTATAADQSWGTASWHQRLMALAFGGDPLAIGPNGPWQGIPGVYIPGTYDGLTWPNQFAEPYVHTDVQSPRVNQLWMLAKGFNAARLDVLLNTQFGNGGFYVTDILNSAADMYNNIEAKLRAGCNPNPNIPCYQFPQTFSPPFILQTRYGITFDDAITLVSLLEDQGVGFGVTTNASDVSAFRTGAMDIVGAGQGGTGNTEFVSFDSVSGGNNLFDGVVSFSPNMEFVTRTLSEMGADFSALAPLRLPTTQDFFNAQMNGIDSGSIGLAGVCNYDLTSACSGNYLNNAAEAKRIMGAMAADEAVRETLMDLHASGADASGAALQPFLAHVASIVQKVSGAVGTDGFGITPLESVASVTSGVPYLTPISGNLYNATITFGAADPFWTQGSSYTLYAVQGWNVGNLAAHQEVRWNGVSLDDLIKTAASTACVVSSATPVGGEQNTGCSFNFTSLPDGHYTFVAEGTFPSFGNAKLRRLVAADVLLVSQAHYGQYLAFGGSRGTFLDHEGQVYTPNPSEHAYDGLDMPNHFVPPFSAEVLGGKAGDSIVGTYLSLAQTSAANATMAVQTALDGLLERQADDAQKAAAAARSQLEISQEESELCGSSNPACDTNGGLVQVGLLSNGGTPLYPVVADGPHQGKSSDPADQIQHFLYVLLQPFYGTQVYVAEAVAPYLFQSNAPSFQDYAGGSLQQAFIQQWAALRAPVGKINELQTMATGVLGTVGAANAALSAASSDLDFECGIGGSLGALASSVGIGFPPSFNLGAIVAQINKCHELTQNVAVDQAQAIAAQENALSALATAASDFSNVVASMAASGAQIQSLLLKAADAQAKSQLEGELSANGTKTSFGLYRAYRDYDVWRAKALLENARRYGLTARRAIEARYVVDLAKATQAEAFVASPATWAGDIYRYDLSMPSSVGLVVPDMSQTMAMGSESTSQGIYVDQVTDYVTNLQNFVSGYAVKRPTAVDQAELDVVSLPGLVPGSAICLQTDGGSICPPSGLSDAGAEGGDGGVPDAASDAAPDGATVSEFASLGAWTLHCPGNGTAGDAWIGMPEASGNVDTACAGQAVGGPAHPDRIRLAFELDPWGRVNNATVEPPFQNRFNVRWTQLAVNFVGTGLKDCTQALDPQGCYQSQYIPYNLTHGAPAWVTDFNEVWHQIDVPTGVIEGAKGLAAEVWLDPLKDGWSTDFITAIARTEFELRPLGGVYILEVPVGPEVVLSRLERVQILIGSSGWVKQQ